MHTHAVLGPIAMSLLCQPPRLLTVRPRLWRSSARQNATNWSWRHKTQPFGSWGMGETWGPTSFGDECVNCQASCSIWSLTVRFFMSGNGVTVMNWAPRKTGWNVQAKPV